MPKYCPICFGEFKEQMTVCPKDKANLVDAKPVEIERLLDIYAASNEIEAERIIAILEDEGIFATESQTGISQLPVSSDTRYIIAVFKENAMAAKKHLEQARKDQVISENGGFI